MTEEQRGPSGRPEEHPGTSGKDDQGREITPGAGNYETGTGSGSGDYSDAGGDLSSGDRSG